MHHHTHIFKSGNSLAIRIPQSFRLENHQEVEIFMRNNELIVRIVHKNLADAFLALPPFPDDVLPDGLEDLPPQERDF